MTGQATAVADAPRLCAGRCGRTLSKARCNLCSRCYWMSLRGHRPKPKSAFAQFLYSQWLKSGKGLHSFGRDDLGITTLDMLIKDGHFPSQRTYDRLKKRYGDLLPPSEVDTESRRERMRRARIQPGPEAIAKRAKTQMGQKLNLSPKERQARRERGRGRFAPGQAPLKQTLRAYLRWHPNPTRVQIRQWARDAGQRLDLPTSTVLATWTPQLEARGLWSRAGRRSMEDRHRFVDGLMAQSTRTQTGRLPRGFWNRAARLLSEHEGQGISGPELYVWYWRHCHRYCENIA